MQMKTMSQRRISVNKGAGGVRMNEYGACVAGRMEIGFCCSRSVKDERR